MLISKLSTFAYNQQCVRMMKMKPYHSALVLAVLVVSAIATSVNSYHRMQSDIECDLDRALAITLHERSDQWLTPDTIQDYRSHLSIDFLKKTSLLCYVVDDRNSRNRQGTKGNGRPQLASKSMTLNNHAIRGYANCSFADVFGQSDQRMPFSLALMSLAWAALAAWRFRRRNAPTDNEATCVALAQHESSAAYCEAYTVGALSYINEEDCFYNRANRQVVRFTPMQHRLMCMFFASKLHQLSKQDICASLWPKKPDASETLYTLIRRIKPIVEDNELTIESERGTAYRLRERTANADN